MPSLKGPKNNVKKITILIFHFFRCELLTFLSHFLLVFNSSINIVIYCWKDEKFRKVLFRLLGFRSTPNIGYMLAARTAAIIGDTAMEAGSFNLIQGANEDIIPRQLTRQETMETCLVDIKPVGFGSKITEDTVL